MTARKAPVYICFIPNVVNTELEMLFIWGKLPVPNEERTVAAAKKAPMKAPVFMILPLFVVIFNLFFI